MFPIERAAPALTDRLADQTAFGYDENSNLLSVTDALTHAPNFTCDNFDRPPCLWSDMSSMMKRD